MKEILISAIRNKNNEKLIDLIKSDKKNKQEEIRKEIFNLTNNKINSEIFSSVINGNEFKFKAEDFNTGKGFGLYNPDKGDKYSIDINFEREDVVVVSETEVFEISYFPIDDDFIIYIYENVPISYYILRKFYKRIKIE